MLQFPRPEGFVQSLRQRLRALGSGIPLLVVEGEDDLRAIFPFLASSAVVVPAGGRTNVLAAFLQLERKLRSTVVFVIDCDGRVDRALKGHTDLVITTNRDIEADLVLELRALERLANEFLSPRADDPAGLARLSTELLDAASALPVHIGVLQVAAATLGFRTRRRGKSGNGGKIRVFDLPSAAPMAGTGFPDRELLAQDLADLTGWKDEEREEVLAGAEALLREPCLHDARCCSACQKQRHANGHHLVDCITAVLAERHAIQVSASEIARAVRIGADRGLLDSWEVAERLRRWEEASGLALLVG